MSGSSIARPLLGQGHTVLKTVTVARLLVTRAATVVCCCCRRGSACRYDCLCLLVVCVLLSLSCIFNDVSLCLCGVLFVMMLTLMILCLFVCGAYRSARSAGEAGRHGSVEVFHYADVGGSEQRRRKPGDRLPRGAMPCRQHAVDPCWQAYRDDVHGQGRGRGHAVPLPRGRREQDGTRTAV